MKIKLPDFSLAYDDAGQGLPLVFVHGYPLNRRMWQPQMRGLQDTARILAVDLRGHGDSQATPAPYSMDLFADDLNAFLEALGIDQKVVLCGLSMGGYITFAFYRKYPHRLAGLILTATRAAADTPAQREARDQAAETARQGNTASIFNSMLPRLLTPKTYAEKPALVARVRKIMEQVSLEGILGDLSAMKERPDSTPTLARIDIPTLFLPGANDQIIPLQEAQGMHTAVHGSQLEIIPEAGHLLNLENPRLFNRAVRRFLRETIDHGKV